MRSQYAEVLTRINAKSILFTALSLLLLIFTIYKSGVQWHHFKISPSSWVYYLLAVGAWYLSLIVQSVRVRIPWEKTFPITPPDTLNGLMLCNFFNCILPGKLGEAVRAWHFSRKNKVSFTRSFASFGVEKYVDAFNYIIYSLMLGVLFSGFPLFFTVILPATVFITSIFVLYLVIIFHRPTERNLLGFLLRLKKIGRWLYKVHFHIKDFLLGLSKKQFFWYAIWGFTMFALNVVQYYMIMRMVDLPLELATITNAFLVSVAMVFVFIVPSAPGNIGVIHFGIYTLLITVAQYSNMKMEKSLMQNIGIYTIYLHLSYFIPEIITGIIVLLKERNILFNNSIPD